jgi:hypothetical protein
VNRRRGRVGGCGEVDSPGPGEERVVEWLVIVNTLMNLRFP